MTNIKNSIPQLATKALLYEANLYPKPGLVDPIDPGAHQDMDIYTFLDSIVALAPFFKAYCEAGLQHEGNILELFEKLRQIGVQAEIEMFQATENINTHKGANFSFAVILGASGYYIKKYSITHFTEKETTGILEIVKEMTAHLVKNDLQNLDTNEALTHGEKLYLKKGRTGIRGEAAAGYPALQHLLLPFLRENKTDDTELLLLRALTLLMSEVEDANILYRGGEAAWQKIKKESKEIFNTRTTKEPFKEKLFIYNETLKKRHLSPGGAADLLSLGIYFALLENIF